MIVATLLYRVDTKMSQKAQKTSARLSAFFPAIFDLIAAAGESAPTHTDAPKAGKDAKRP